MIKIAFGYEGNFVFKVFQNQEILRFFSDSMLYCIMYVLRKRPFLDHLFGFDRFLAYAICLSFVKNKDPRL